MLGENKVFIVNDIKEDSSSCIHDDVVQSLILDNNKNSKNMLGPPGGGLFPAPNSQQRISNAENNDLKSKGSRSKVALKPGRSLMNWIHLANSGQDIQGLRGRIIAVTPSELSKHNTPDDCWMAIRGTYLLLSFTLFNIRFLSSIIIVLIIVSKDFKFKLGLFHFFF